MNFFEDGPDSMLYILFLNNIDSKKKSGRHYGIIYSNVIGKFVRNNQRIYISPEYIGGMGDSDLFFIHYFSGIARQNGRNQNTRHTISLGFRSEELYEWSPATLVDILCCSSCLSPLSALCMMVLVNVHKRYIEVWRRLQMANASRNSLGKFSRRP